MKYQPPFLPTLLLAMSCNAFSTISSRTHRTNTKLHETKGNELWRIARVDRISDWIEGHTMRFPNPLSLKPNVPLSWFVDDDAAVAAKVEVGARATELDQIGLRAEAFTKAGPRLDIAHDPKGCKAAIVTCGGICPGLNTVVREIVMCLRRQYGVEVTYGTSFLHWAQNPRRRANSHPFP